jgi:hypothetical protein
MLCSAQVFCLLVDTQARYLKAHHLLQENKVNSLITQYNLHSPILIIVLRRFPWVLLVQHEQIRCARDDTGRRCAQTIAALLHLAPLIRFSGGPSQTRNNSECIRTWRRGDRYG